IDLLWFGDGCCTHISLPGLWLIFVLCLGTVASPACGLNRDAFTIGHVESRHGLSRVVTFTAVSDHFAMRGIVSPVAPPRRGDNTCGAGHHLGLAAGQGQRADKAITTVILPSTAC